MSMLDELKVTISEKDGNVDGAWKGAYWHWEVGIHNEKTDRGFTVHYYGAKGVKEIDEEEVLNSVLSDALLYCQNQDSFLDFCSELGYTYLSEYTEAKNAYDGCKNTYKEFIRILDIAERNFEDIACEWLNDHNI